MNWTVSRSRVVLRDRWISLRADDCVTAAGIEVAPFYVLEYPDWVHAVAVDADRHVLLVRQYRHGFGGMTLELPGGVMDPVDSDPAATAARELIEETGYTAPVFRRVACLSPNPATHSNRLHIILAEGARLTNRPAPEPSEDIAVIRIPVDEAIRIALAGEMVHAQHVAGLLIGLKAADLF